MKSLRIALLSDLHAHSLPVGSPKAPSYLSIHAPLDQPLSNPIAGLQGLIKDKGLKADMLLCAGDMGDKADSAALAFVWDKIQYLGESLGANSIFATAGNHDMDSRYTKDFDAKGTLLSLRPHFPGLVESECNKFWARNYAIVEGGDWRLVLLNSAAYHGARAPEGDEHAGGEEYERGRVSPRTLSALGAELSNLPKVAANILLTHHHPVRNSDVPQSIDYSEMVDGDRLINLLSGADVGDWLVVHGHKHFPKIWYAGTDTGSGPVIFSAGSFSVRLYSEVASIARNQFYILEIPLDLIREKKVGLLGQVEAWDWITAQGWVPAQSGSGIPHAAGFGWRENSDKVASDISNIYTAADQPVMAWRQLEQELPLIRFLSPGAMSQVIQRLGSNHTIKVLSDEGRPAQLGTADA